MKRIFLGVLLSCSIAPPSAWAGQALSVRVVQRNPHVLLDVRARDVPINSLVRAIRAHTSLPIRVEIAPDRLVSFSRRSVAPENALAALAAQERLQFTREARAIILRDTSERYVTLDVQNAGVREILYQLKRQCGIKNMLVDPDVQGNGTFLFRDVPCSLAFRTIFRSLGLASEELGNSLVHVQTGVKR